MFRFTKADVWRSGHSIESAREQDSNHPANQLCMVVINLLTKV